MIINLTSMINIRLTFLGPVEVSGCKNDDDCSASETCLNKQCVNPCISSNPCAQNGECQALNHRAVCKCLPGYVGDPFINCYKGRWKCKNLTIVCLS